MRAIGSATPTAWRQRASTRCVLAEFAWHIFEPHEGTFDFDLFDRAIDVLGKAGVKTIMCTPTATPPRWLTARYPEVLRVDAKWPRHEPWLAPACQPCERRVPRAFKAHHQSDGRALSGNSYIIGWQTDNELNTSGSLSYGPVTLNEFQAFLRDKYKTIDALNDAWGGHFWATAYDDFDQVVLPTRLCACAWSGRPMWSTITASSPCDGAIPARSGADPARHQSSLVRLPQSGAYRRHRLPRRLLDRPRLSRLRHLPASL